MNRTWIWQTSIIGLTLALATSTRELAMGSEADRPNILFIMSDDHAAHGIGAYGGRLAALDPTPNIDRLAREGIRLDQRLLHQLDLRAESGVDHDGPIQPHQRRPHAGRRRASRSPDAGPSHARRGLRDGHGRQVAPEIRTGLRLLLRPARARLLLQSDLSRPGTATVAGEYVSCRRLRFHAFLRRDHQRLAQVAEEPQELETSRSS